MVGFFAAVLLGDVRTAAVVSATVMNATASAMGLPVGLFIRELI
jgi:hypothetical protein